MKLLILISALLMGASAFAQVTPSTQETSTTTEGRVADEQPTNQKDSDIIRNVRRELMKDDTLSVTAQNIQITSKQGRVLLKGNVKTAAEKERVEQVAGNVYGVSNVENQVTVTK